MIGSGDDDASVDALWVAALTSGVHGRFAIGSSLPSGARSTASLKPSPTPYLTATMTGTGAAVHINRARFLRFWDHQRVDAKSTVETAAGDTLIENAGGQCGRPDA